MFIIVPLLYVRNIFVLNVKDMMIYALPDIDIPENASH